MLVSGRFRIDFADRAVVLAAPGDYVLYRGVGHGWQAEEPSVVLVIRWPSLSAGTVTGTGQRVTCYQRGINRVKGAPPCRQP